jgi:hypothetical protein
MEQVMAEEALTQFETELGLRSPETSKLADTAKDLGPAVTNPADETKTTG